MLLARALTRPGNGRRAERFRLVSKRQAPHQVGKGNSFGERTVGNTYIRRWLGGLAGLGLAAVASGAFAADPLKLSGAACVEPPLARCPEKDCPSALVTQQGSVIEPKTGRTYFLDYPCDLKKGEKVTFILSLHGGGSYGNWQRHYFPIVDQVGKHRLVIATPNTRGWSARDDEYLQSIATSVIDQIGKENIARFWLVGHSMGSAKARGLVCTDFFRDKVDGYASLSGGRVGSPPGVGTAPGNFIPRQDDSIAAANPSAAGNRPAGPPPGAPPGARGTPAPTAAMTVDPQALNCDFSHIFSSGEHEASAIELPATSWWADKLGCKARVKGKEVVDTKPGYVYDGSRQQYGSAMWGRLPRPGKAVVWNYPGCRDGRIVADVTRLDKGHTEGYEPKITEELLAMMEKARGGKLAGR
jgi:pimeloyl-ACP methyl ester carboxylesterase